MKLSAKLDNYPGVTIHSHGSVTRDRDGVELGSLNNGGYVTLTLTRHDGHRCAVGRNRLVAMAFCECPGDFNDFVVNHKDRNRQNDDYRNLEWITQKENIAYSGRLDKDHPKFKAIQVRNFDTKEVTDYDCMLDAAKALGLHKDLVQVRSKLNGSVIYKDRNQFRLNQGNSPWEDNPSSNFVLVKDIETNEITRFYLSIDAAKYIGISPASLSLAIKSGIMPLLLRRFLAKMECDRSDWREVSDAVLDDSKRRGTKAIRIRDPKRNITKVFSTGKDCAEYLGIRPSTLNMRLKTGDPNRVYADGFQFEYISPTS